MAVMKMALAAFRGGKRSIPFTAFCITLSSVLISFIFYLSVQIYKYGIFDAKGDEVLLYQTIILVFFILFAVIFAGCAMICSALSVCYNRIIRLLGVFSSCGADRKQKTAVLCLEAAIYALISTPLGTVCGTYAAHVFSKAVFPLSRGYTYGFSAGAAVFSFIVSFAAVVLSSLVPAAKLSRISVLSALKYQTKINVALHESLVSRFLSKLFGYKARLAGQIYTNEKGKNRTLLLGTVFAQSLFVFLYSWFVYDRQGELQRGRQDAMPPYQYSAFPYVAGFCGVILILCVIASLCASAASSDAHKSDYAALRSLGASLSDLTALSVISSLYLFLYMSVFTVLFTLLADMAMHLRFSFETMLPFVYPFEALLGCIAVNAVVCILSALYMVMSIRKTKIISGLKMEY